MTRTILVCCGTGCIANGSLKVAEALRFALAGTDVSVETAVKETGCNGFCENGPIVRIMPDDISFYKVKPEDAPDIAASLGGSPPERTLQRRRWKSCVASDGQSFLRAAAQSRPSQYRSDRPGKYP